MSNNPFDIQLDSLPYYDPDPTEDPKLQAELNSLIAQELRSILSSNKSNEPQNLTHLSAPRPLPSKTSFLGTELTRVQQRRPLKEGEGLDTTRYGMPFPEGDNEKDWKAAYESSLVQLEQSQLRAMNVQLLQQHGANSHKVSNYGLENSIKRVEKDIENIRAEIEEINRNRQTTQQKCGHILDRLDKRWAELVSGNLQVEIGCISLQNEIAELQEARADLAARLESMQT